jgi:hypothetical protein
MKLLFTTLTVLSLTIGLTAKPEKGGKGEKFGRPSREEMDSIYSQFDFKQFSCNFDGFQSSIFWNIKAKECHELD